MVEGSDETTETTVPDEFHDLFERKAFGVMTTLLPNDTFHMTVVWIDYDGTHLVVNSAEGRRKVKNVRRDPRVGVVVIDPSDPYRYLWVSGTVDEITKSGAVEHADGLASRYLGVEAYPYHDRDPDRLLIKIRPEICHGYASRVTDDFDE